jgi:aminoglycoside phosphotransferase family enzyme/nucleoside-triphosphatase THEP1
MKPVYLLTGQPGTGKTSLIKQALVGLEGTAGGFYTEEIRSQGVRQGFRLVTLDGQEAVLAHTDFDKRFRVGKYGVDVGSLDRVGVSTLRRAADKCDLVVIDEIGKMELLSAAFRETVLAIIGGGKKVLGTIMLHPHPVADSIKRQPQVNLVMVTRAGYRQVLQDLQFWLRGGKMLTCSSDPPFFEELEEYMAKLPDLIKALLDPKAYPGPLKGVELTQTQMSYIFLAGDYVYKIKKPVNLGYLDYTTLGNRHLYCQKEVELNRRLCPDVYLGVLPVTNDNGLIRFGGHGEVEEYAVKMRRLPAAAMMDVLLGANRVTPAMVAEVAAVLAAFHEKAATGAAINAFGSLEVISRNTGENFSQTEKYIGITIPRDTYRRLKAYTEGFIKENAGLFHRRVAEGRVRDGHGDLHAAHVCFFHGICIYDCIEFNDRFRYGDVASEVAFLAMDLDHYGRPDLSKDFVTAYVAGSRDGELERLLNFYKCYRAYVRGKVSSFQYDDPYLSAREKKKALAAARSYFELAESYINI